MAQKTRRCRCRGIPIMGAEPWRRQWTVERLIFGKGILRLILGPACRK